MPIGHSTAGSLRVTVVEVGEEFRALAAIVNGLSSRSELKRKEGLDCSGGLHKSRNGQDACLRHPTAKDESIWHIYLIKRYKGLARTYTRPEFSLGPHGW